jgi:glycosyltransferase involved in cell wall biosynthesis
VIAISERFAKIYRDDRGVPAGRVFMVPNWGDERLIVPDAGGLELRAELRIPADAFLLVYGGNIGIAAGVEGVIEAWGRLPVASRPYLLIAGEGASLVACQALAMQIAPLQVRFYTPWPAEKTSAVYAAADVLVLPTRGAQSLASVPSKLISYMLAARPVLAQALPDSDLAHTIREAGCGWVVEPDRPEILADTIRQIMALPRDELRRLGQAGRDYALRHLTRSACLPKVIEVLESVGKKKGVS